MMLFTTILLLITGVYTWYNTSSRAQVRAGFLRKIVSSNKFLGRCIAGILLLAALLLFVSSYGFAIGSFYFLSMVMCVTGLLVILSPLRLIKS